MTGRVLVRTYINLTVVIGTVVGCFILLELGLRLLDGKTIWPTENLILERVDLVRVHLRNTYDPLLGWAPRENVSDGVEPGETYTTGQYGARMPVPGEIRPLPKHAILAVGDSFTAGAEVGDRDTWPAYLERMVGEPVNNPSPGGWAADQIVLRAESLLEPLQPHTVIVDFLSDDIGRAGYEIFGGGPKPYFLVNDGKLVHMNNPVPRYKVPPSDVGILRSVFGYSYLVTWSMDRLGNTAWFNDPGLFYKKVDNDPVEVSCLLLKRLKERTDADDVRLIFVMQYGGIQLTRLEAPPRDAQKVLECTNGLGIQSLDTWRMLKEVAVSDDEEFATLFVENEISRHMSAKGNKLIATMIEATYRDQPYASLPE